MIAAEREGRRVNHTDLPGMSSCVVELPRMGREVVTFACGNQLRVGARRAL